MKITQSKPDLCEQLLTGIAKGQVEILIFKHDINDAGH